MKIDRIHKHFCHQNWRQSVASYFSHRSTLSHNYTEISTQINKDILRKCTPVHEYSAVTLSILLALHQAELHFSLLGTHRMSISMCVCRICKSSELKCVLVFEVAFKI